LARLQLLGHINLRITPCVGAGKHPPALTIGQGDGGQPLEDVGQRCVGQVRRLEGQHTMAKHLKSHPPRIAWRHLGRSRRATGGCAVVMVEVAVVVIGVAIVVVVVGDARLCGHGGGAHVGLLGHQQRRRLGQVGIQQFVQLVLGALPGQGRRRQPNRQRADQQQRQQPRLQRPPPAHPTSRR
jgi:hypothetical protein